MKERLNVRLQAESWTHWNSPLKKEKRPQLNTKASILGLPKIFSEVIVASKCGPLSRIEKQAMS